MGSDPLKAVRGTSFLYCYASMCNTILGAGVLSLPYAFSLTGWAMGAVLLSIGGVFNSTGCNLLALCAAQCGTPSSISSIMKPLGKWWAVAVDTNMVLQLWGTAIAYLIVAGDLMPAALEQLGVKGPMLDRFNCVLVAFSIAAPLSCPHDIKWLGITSSFSVVFLIYVAFIVLLYSTNDPSLDPCEDQALDDDSVHCKGETNNGEDLNTHDFLEAMSIFIFGFASQITVFPIVNELVDVTPVRLNRVFMASTLTGMVLYVVVSFCAYATYGDSIKSDLLLNYPKAPAVSAARVMISIVVTFAYPLQVNPTRRSMVTILKNLVDGDNKVSKFQQSVRYWVITFFFLLGSLGIALTVDDLGIVIALVGAFGGTLIMFILPGYLFLYHFPKKEEGLVLGYLSRVFGLDRGSEEANLALLPSEQGLKVEDIDDVSERDIPLPVVTQTDRTFAWIHLILGIVVGPACVVAIFV